MQRLFDYYQKNQFIPTTFDIMSREKLAQHRRKRENLYVNKLSLPKLIWREAKVLEVGCASGENALPQPPVRPRRTPARNRGQAPKNVQNFGFGFGFGGSSGR